MTEPGTTPPPSTRSNSTIPVSDRSSGDTRTSSKRTTSEEKEVMERAMLLLAPRTMSSSSTKEFQCSHSWQRNVVLVFDFTFISAGLMRETDKTQEIGEILVLEGKVHYSGDIGGFG